MSNFFLGDLVPSSEAKTQQINDSRRYLESIVSVKSRSLATPPPTPANQDNYLVAAVATGEWAGHEGEIALFYEGIWYFVSGLRGVWLLVLDELPMSVVNDGVSWIDVPVSATSPVPVLTSDRTYYIRSDGSDSNDGVTDSPTGAFQTLERGLEAWESLDPNGFTVTILQVKVAGDPSPLVTAIASPLSINNAKGRGRLIVQGDPALSSDRVLTGSAGIFSVEDFSSMLEIQGFQIETTSTTAPISILRSHVLVQDCLLSQTGTDGAAFELTGAILSVNNLSVQGLFLDIFDASDRSSLVALGVTTFVGSVGNSATNGAFVRGEFFCSFDGRNSTFSGIFTGQVGDIAFSSHIVDTTGQAITATNPVSNDSTSSYVSVP